MLKQIKKLTGIGALCILLALAMMIATGTGAMHITPAQVLAIVLDRAGIHLPVAYEENMAGVLWIIRLPRVVLGALIGAGLGISGAALQGLFRNPLADPGLIGLSAGASLAAVAMIVLTTSLTFLPQAGLLRFYSLNIATFCGAVGAALLIFRISRSGGHSIMSTMLLAGIAINALCVAFTGLMTYLSNDEQLRSITFWTMGSLGGASWETVLAVLPFILAPALLLPRLGHALNIFTLGEREAMHSGVQVQLLKTKVILLATMAVAAGVAVAGIIGFVGLIVPHMVRRFTGPDHRVLIPSSALSGALLLTVADLACRTIVAPAELPVGIITAIIGAPFFIWLIIKEKRTILA